MGTEGASGGEGPQGALVIIRVSFISSAIHLWPLCDSLGNRGTKAICSRPYAMFELWRVLLHIMGDRTGGGVNHTFGGAAA